MSEIEVVSGDQRDTPAPTQQAPDTRSRSAANRLATLQNLFFSENKPDTLLPLDIALATYLILRQSDDHFIYDSQDTLAARLGCERKAVARSIGRLEEEGWITTKVPYSWSPKTKRKTRALAQTLGLSVNPAKLPQTGDRATRPSVISEDAKAVAARHTAFLKKIALENGKRAYFPRNFARQQEHAAQRLIDDAGSAQLVLDIANFAVQDSRFSKAARKSLYELRRRWKQIKAAYEESTMTDVAQAEEKPRDSAA